MNEDGEQDVVLKLVYVIAKHFIGDPNIFSERNSEILQNLRCRTLSDFKWYHDVFLAKLFFRPDARASFWKERFLYGLPRAMHEKVQGSLREKYNGTIPYEALTYGDLISEVKKEGLKLCSQLRLQQQVKKDLKASRKDLGSFCAQYGINMQILPSQISKKSKPYRDLPYKNNKKFKKFKKSKPQKENEQKQKFHKKNTKKNLGVLSVVKRVI